MSPYELHRLLRRITYKPGTSINCHDEMDLSGQIYIKASMQVADVEDRARTIQVAVMTPIQLDTLMQFNEGQALHFIRNKVLLDLETHELDEWFKVDGQHVVAPHGGHAYQPTGYRYKDLQDASIQSLRERVCWQSLPPVPHLRAA